jgi:hypothetical protein
VERLDPWAAWPVGLAAGRLDLAVLLDRVWARRACSAAVRRDRDLAVLLDRAAVESDGSGALLAAAFALAAARLDRAVALRGDWVRALLAVAFALAAARLGPAVALRGDWVRALRAAGFALAAVQFGLVVA